MTWEDLFYWLLKPFVLLVAAGFCLHPIPEEVIIVGAGVSAGSKTGEGWWAYRWLMLPVCLVGALIADVLLYGIGRFFGPRVLKLPVLSQLAPPEKQEKIRDNFHHYGVWIFVVGRMVPGVRTALFVTAGSMRLPLVRFCIADGVGALLGTSLIFLLGFALGAVAEDFITSLEEKITPYKTIILGVLLVASTAYLAYLFLRKPTGPTGDPEEVPIFGHTIATHLPTSGVFKKGGPAGEPAKAVEAPDEAGKDEATTAGSTGRDAPAERSG
jgi:membrane protein DedA with SNARE-associated domain